MSQSAFEKTVDGKEVCLFTLTNENGLRANISNYGARVVDLFVPDAAGKPLDVSIGFDSIDGYLNSTEPYYGATIGRFANRIAHGNFSIGDTKYHINPNNGSNALHGGKHGFQAVVWDAELMDASTLQLSYLSPHLEEGFPGNLRVVLRYVLTSDNALRITYQAETDQTTILNLTNHTYFNLNGAGSGSIMDHRVQIHANQYTPINSSQIPLGDHAQVSGTPFDFRSPAIVGDQLEETDEQLKNGRGYDHNYVLDQHDPDAPVACAIGDKSRIKMEVYTDQPGMQFYTGNFMQGQNTLKGGHTDDFRTAFCMETQHFPDSPNQPSYPSTLLEPGSLFQSFTSYKFSIAE
jgi:aldose 1-epimerase